MRMNSPCFLSAAFAVLLLASCSTSTLPTAADMDRYYQQAEQLAQDHIAILDAQRRRGTLTQEQFDSQSSMIRGRIANHATDLAWARHENVEAQLRALGVPTGDHLVKVQVPGTGAGESFYRRAGEPVGSSQYNAAPYGGSVLGGPNRGDRPELPPVRVPGGQPEPGEPAPEAEPEAAPAPAPVPASAPATAPAPPP
jgi:hypothetical protein